MGVAQSGGWGGFSHPGGLPQKDRDGTTPNKETQVLHKADERDVTFCELVEHPGGHDGGEFPQYETFTLTDDGRLVYETDYPVTVNGDFQSYGSPTEDAENFVHCPGKEDALARLQSELAKAEKAAAQLRLLVDAATDEKVEYEVVWLGDDGEE